MAQPRLHFAVLLLVSACGGRETGDVPGGTGSGGGGGAVTVGTGGSSGTAITTTGTGGSSTAGQSGTGGSAGGVDFGACTPMDSCVLEPLGACGPGCEPVPISSYIAINSSQEEAYNMSRPIPPCAAGICLAPPPGVATSQNYYAACEMGHCEPVDVRLSALSACSSDSDCYLRAGTTCCGCGNNNLIAVSKKANVEQALCGPAHACAADCVAAPLPPNVSAYCSVGGHCLVGYAFPDGGLK
jgi:hypothetical protein